MKVEELIKNLESYRGGNIPVVIDFDTNGYYSLEDVFLVTDEEGRAFLNLKSSNEA